MNALQLRFDTLGEPVPKFPGSGGFERSCLSKVEEMIGSMRKR